MMILLELTLKRSSDWGVTSLADFLVCFRFLKVVNIVNSKLESAHSVLSEEGFGCRILYFKFFG